MMRFKSLFKIVICSIALVACGGGGGGDGGSSGSGSNTPPTSDLNGIYQGTFTQQGAGTFDLTGLIQDGRVVAISEGANTIYDGGIGTTQSGVSGNVTVYEQNGGAFDNASLQGTFESRSVIDGTFSGNSGSSGTFSMDYDPIYERDSDLSLLNDVWSFSDGSFSVTVSIDPNGSFTGSDTDGCVYSGTISIIDSAFNVYQVDFTASSCGQFNGSYSGFVTLADQTQKNDTMIVSGSNNNFLFIYPFTRQ